MITDNWKTWTRLEIPKIDFEKKRVWCISNLGHRGIESGWYWSTKSFRKGPIYFYFKDPEVATLFKISV